MTKFFEIRKKSHFWPILPIFGAMRILLRNPAVSRTSPHSLLSSCQKLEKTNDQIPRKLPDRRMDVRTDGPYFIGPFWPRPGVQ